MEKVEITEIKKTLDLKKHCAVEKIKTFYIDEEKNVVSTSEKFLYSIDEEKAFKYLDMLKKALSGKIGKNIFNIEFRTSEEDEKRETFEKAYYGKDAESAEKIVDTIISNLESISSSSALAPMTCQKRRKTIYPSMTQKRYIHIC